jgi:thioredoxin reductase (NADPH)
MDINDHWDVLIIGAGPIGLACGIEACKAGLRYLIVDKGCLVNSIYHYPLNMTFFSTSEKLEIGNVPFISHGNKPVRSEALEYYRRVASTWNLNVSLYEPIEEIVPSDGLYNVRTIKKSFTAGSIIIATGFYDLPNLLGIEGEHLPKVHHYYREPHPYFAKKVVVIGAANSAVDVALECYRKNADVTMVIREKCISDRVKYWVKPDIENRIREGSIKAYFNASVQYIGKQEIGILTPEGPLLLENDYVLAMTGYVPDFTFLKKTGIQVSDDGFSTPVFNPSTMETNVKNIYLAGVICGGMNTHKWFIENSRVHAEMVLKEIVRKSNRLT